MSSGSESELNNVGKLKDVESYTMWDFEVKILFKSKNLWDIVDGTETLDNQEDDKKKKAWKSLDAKAQHIIIMTIDQSVKMHVVTCDTSKQMYDTLKRLFQRDTTQQKCSLLQEFYNFKFDLQKDMMSNIAYIQNIAFKLNRLDQKVDDTMLLTKILSILPDQYKHFSSAWDSTSATEKTLENLKARLLQEEAKTVSDCEQVAFKTKSQATMEVGQDVRIECNSNDIGVSIFTKSGVFNGMIYPKGLSKNSSCMSEFFHQRSPVHYKLPLRSCNTMSTELFEGGVEYFNTIVVQPHRKLVTNQGRGFHISCRYQTRDKTITNDIDVSTMEPTTLFATMPMPGCTMKIFSGDPSDREVAENVKIGDPLTLVVSIDDQNIYGLKVSDCLVRDGLGWGEQRLIDSYGCPVDQEIMGMFHYSSNMTTALVHFQAHKFPYTASVYYQCNVRLCLKADDGCGDVPPPCNDERRRRKRNDDDGEGSPATIEVYSGLYVNEANELGVPDQLDLVNREKALDDPDNICISQRNFAIAIAVAGLILMLMVVAAFIILLARRRSRKEISTTGSSIYSGPYTNTAYSHSS